MRKILSFFLVALLFLVFHTQVFAADSTIGDCTGPDKKHFQTTKDACEAFNRAWGKSVIAFTPGVAVAASTAPSSVSQALAISNSPRGDCVGPDKKHFQATKDVCETFNKAWGKPVSFSQGATTPVTSDSSGSSSSTLSEVINKSLSSGSPLGDCVGPDKKHLDAPKEVCEEFNKKWGKNPSFTPGVTTGTGFSSVRSSAGSSSSGSSGGGSSTGGTPTSGGGSKSSGGGGTPSIIQNIFKPSDSGSGKSEKKESEGKGKSGKEKKDKDKDKDNKDKGKD